MIVNTPVQDPLIDKAKAEKFLIDMYAQNGKVLTQSEAANHVNNKHFKKLLPSLHLESGSGMADEAKIEMIYTSLLKPVEDPPQINNQLPEKKNQVDNTPTVSPSTSEEDSSLLELNPIKVDPPTAKARIGQYTYKDDDGDTLNSTHLMRAEQLSNGNWVGFPTLFQDKDGTWVTKYMDKPWKQAYNEANKRGEVVDFGKDKEAALAWGEGSWKELYKASNPDPLFQGAMLFRSSVYGLNESFMSMDEESAAQVINQRFSDYGIKASPMGVGTDQIMVSMQGEGQPITLQLYTPSYQQRLAGLNALDPQSKTVEALMSESLVEFQDLLISGEKVMSENLVSTFSLTPDERLPLFIARQTANFTQPKDVNTIFLSSLFGRDANYYFDNGTFNVSKYEEDLNNAMSHAISGDTSLDFYGRMQTHLEAYENFRENGGDKTYLYQQINQKYNKNVQPLTDRDWQLLIDKDYEIFDIKNPKDLAEKINLLRKDLQAKKIMAANTITSLLRKTNRYNLFQNASPELMNEFKKMGFNEANVPTDGIKINGISSSYAELLNNIYDYDFVTDVRAGRQTLEVGDGEDYGNLGYYIDQAKGLVAKQESFRFDYPLGESIGEGIQNVENWAQSVLFGGGDILVNTSYIVYDSLVGMGLSPEQASVLVYGLGGLPGLEHVNPLNPEVFNNLKDQYLPQFEGDIMDSGSAGEFFAKTAEPVGGSVATTAIFVFNPKLGMLTVGLSGYGGSLRNYDDLKQGVLEKKKRGEYISPEEQAILDMSGAEKRMLSLLKSGQEVAVTSLFTYKYFKGLMGNKKTMENMSKTELNKFVTQYTKSFNTGVLNTLNRTFGVDKSLLKNELSEESLIALNNYMIEVVSGTRKYDQKELNKIMIETGIITTISSYTSGVAIRQIQNPKIRAAGDNIILNNLEVIDGQNQNIHFDHMTKASEIKLFEEKVLKDKRIKDKEKYLANSLEYQTLLANLSDIEFQIGRHEQRRVELLLEMSDGDKILFMKNFQRMVALSSVKTNETASPSARQAAETEMEKVRQETNEMLSKYPSELSFYFTEEQVQNSYLSKAADQILKEKTAEAQEKGVENFEINVDFQSEEVQILASQMYLEDIRKGNRNKQDLNSFGTFGVEPIVYNVVSATERDEFNLESSINQARQRQTTLTELPLEQAPSETKSPLPETQEDVNNKRNSSIFGRLTMMNKDGNLKDRMGGQFDVIIEYFNDLKDGRAPKYGKVEALLDAQDIIGQLTALAGDSKLNVNAKGKNLASLIINFSNYLYASQDSYTLDQLLNTMIKDERIRGPLADVVREGLRLSAEAEQTGGRHKKEDKNLWLQDYKDWARENKSKSRWKNLISTKDMGNPNSLENSYEMYLLHMLKRESGELDVNGVDLEFTRAKNLILQELDLARQDYENIKNNYSVKKDQYLQKLNTLRTVVNRLNLYSAESFADISKNALPFNLNAINRIAERFDGMFDDTKRRMTDYKGNQDNQFFYSRGTYTPGFIRNERGIVKNDYLGVTALEGNVNANNLKDVTRPENLNDELRLDLGMYFDNAYNAYSGVMMDSKAYNNFLILDMVSKSEEFNNLFEDGQVKDMMMIGLQNRLNYFEAQVRDFNRRSIDISTVKGGKFKSFLGVAYGTVGAISLTRFTQPISQFTSALAGTSPLLRNDRARNYLRQRSAQFITFTAGYNNGNLSTNYGAMVLDKLGLNTKNGRLSNIYAKSRTGLRNAKRSELSLDLNKSYSPSYYLTAFNLDPNDNYVQKIFKNIIKAGDMTYDKFINLMASTNETALDLFLANADGAAANTAFEAHYLDYMLSKGEDITDLDAWWEKQNANPNIDAINHADARVSETMRQTAKSGEAGVYINQDTFKGRILSKVLFPFHRFIINAKQDVTNAYTILMDPDMPLDQKEMAAARIRGKMAEIITFGGIKTLGNVSYASGLVGVYGLMMGIDDDDIEEWGGVTRFLGENKYNLGLPIIEAAENFDPTNFPEGRKGAESLEAYNQLIAFQNMYTAQTDFGSAMANFEMEYENKFSAKKVYGALETVAKDLVSTMQPLALPDILEDLMIRELNEGLGTDISEFISADLKKSQTTDGWVNIISKNAGYYGIAFESADAMRRAYQLSNGYLVKSGGDFPDKQGYVTAVNGPMREDLQRATQLLFKLRVLSIIAPGPRADIDKYADILERNIDKFFLSSKPDLEYIKLTGDDPRPGQDDK